MNEFKKISRYRKWKKNHDRKQMLLKVNFYTQKTSDRRNNKPRVKYNTSKKISIDEYEHVYAPSNFSLVDNIEEVLNFIDKVSLNKNGNKKDKNRRRAHP